jgi:hypothetical protein
MAKIKTNQVYIIAGVVAAAIVAYFGGKYIKKLKDEKAAALLAAQQIVVTPVAPDGVKPVVTPVAELISNPFVNKAELLAFQKWVFDVKKDKSLATTKFPNGQDGSWGKLSAAAWTKYGKEYLTSKETGDVSTDLMKKEIDFIINYSKGSGEYVQREYLEKMTINPLNRSKIKNWADAIRKRIDSSGTKGTYFKWSVMIFDSYSGNNISNVDYIDQEVKAKPNGKAFLKPDRYSGSGALTQNTSLGKVRAMFWNNDQKLLFLYIPDVQATWKWTTNNQITTN